MSECPVCLGVPGYDIHMCGKGGFDMPEPSVDGAAWNRSTGAQQQLLNREIDSLREMAKEANDLAALQSDLAAVKAENAQLLIDDNAAKDIIERLMAELARAPVKVGYVKKSDAKYMPQINQEMVLIVKGLGLLCPENGYQPIYIDTPEREISHAHKGEEEKR